MLEIGTAGGLQGEPGEIVIVCRLQVYQQVIGIEAGSPELFQLVVKLFPVIACQVGFFIHQQSFSYGVVNGQVMEILSSWAKLRFVAVVLKIGAGFHVLNYQDELLIRRRIDA